jgi:hypothetical protein
MTMIFQLFCVDDLKELGTEGREELLRIVRGILQPTDHHGHQDPAQLVLSVSNDSQLGYGDEAPPQILDALQQRFDDVSQQLYAPLPSAASSVPPLDPARELFQQFMSHSNGRRGIPEHDADRILEWAVSCEVNNYNFYYTMIELKQKTYQMFQRRTGQRPKGPDSLYSPFNPLHPLYELFSSIVLTEEDDQPTC